MANVASAKRHAQAVYQLALENNTLDAWRDELQAISSALKDETLLSILENPKIHFTDKVELIKKVFPKLSQYALNFIYLLVSRQRLVILDDIVKEYERLVDAKKGLEHANVTTAIELGREDKEKIAKRIANLTGKKIMLSTQVDPEILGGFVARIGDKLIDGSTRSRLQALKKELKTAV